MSEISEYFLGSNSSVIEYETLEISHSAFSKTYYIVRNNQYGLTATLEDDSEVEFDPHALRIRGIGARETLDFGLQIDFGDVGEILPLELDRIAEADAFDEIPQVIFRTFRSDDLTKPLRGPIALEIRDLNSNVDGSSFEAKAKSLNETRTGELYRIDRFPGLRGFL